MLIQLLPCAVDRVLLRVQQVLDEENQLDLATRVQLTDNVTLSLTVTNLLDKKPPLVGSTAGSTSYNSGNTFPSTYDALGRRYTMQINVRF